MCLATPRRVLRIEGERVEIDWDGESLWVATGGIADLALGDFVLVHAGLVLARLSAAEADQILELYASLEEADSSAPFSEFSGEVRA